MKCSFLLYVYIHYPSHKEAAIDFFTHTFAFISTSESMVNAYWHLPLEQC